VRACVRVCDVFACVCLLVVFMYMCVCLSLGEFVCAY